MEATIFTKDFCGYCVRAKALLKQKGISVTEIDGVLESARMQSALEAETNPTKTFPQIWLDGKYIGGYDKLVEYFNATNS